MAASTDLTGSSKLGGNWNLEYQTGKLNTGVVFSNDAQNRYGGRLLTYTVTSINDAGAGSLRAAINTANGTAVADDIRFDPTVFNGAQAAITLASTLAIDVNTGDLNISGAFGASNVTVSGNNLVRVFNISGFGNTTFDSLRIINGNAIVGNGGGINNNGNGAVTLTNSTVSGNTSGIFGGGIFSFRDVTLTNSTVSGNTASWGGGIFSFRDVTLTNSTVSGNTANTYGGGIVSIGTVTLTNSTVSGNTAGLEGGGIIVEGTVTLTNSTVSGNTAGLEGGGIIVEGAVTLTNSTVSGNRTNGSGGGIWGINGGTITNSTITNNIADADNNGTGIGGGIFVDGGIFTIANSIIAGNFDGGLQAPDLATSAGLGFTDGGNNLIGANDGFAATFPTSALVGTIANPINPQLAPLGNYGDSTQTHALLPNSPALNAGNNANATVGNDQRGATRIFGGVVDIGAFESQGFSLTPLANSTPQSTNINTSFAQLLGVQVTENFVNAPIPAPNILVTFTPSSSSANGVFAGNTNVLTNNLGIALAPTFTANGVSGSYTVAATATGFTPASFSLTNSALPATNKVVNGFGGVFPSREDVVNGFGGVFPSREDVVNGFGGVFPSREDLEGHSPRLDEQDLEVSFTQVLCLDPSLATTQTTSIPTCKK